MNILGIETATEVCAVALVRNEILLSEIMKEEKHIHAEQLVPMVHQILSSCNMGLQELDGIAISIGPGSFTGLRIGLSVAKGLAYSSNLPLVAVSTLRGIAYSTVQMFPTISSFVVPIVEIQRDEFAIEILKKENILETDIFEPPVILTKNSRETVSAMFNEQYENYFLCGHGAKKFYDTFFTPPVSVPNITLAGKELLNCNARSIAMAGAIQLQRNSIAEIASLEPFYGKDFIAKKSTLIQRITQ